MIFDVLQKKEKNVKKLLTFQKYFAKIIHALLRTDDSERCPSGLRSWS